MNETVFGVSKMTMEKSFYKSHQRRKIYRTFMRRFYFYSSYRLVNLTVRYSDFPYKLLNAYAQLLLYITIPQQSDTFVTNADPMLTHQCHPQFIVYIRDDS